MQTLNQITLEQMKLDRSGSVGHLSNYNDIRYKTQRRHTLNHNHNAVPVPFFCYFETYFSFDFPAPETFHTRKLENCSKAIAL